ncbi:hypothetical protein A8C32_08105 [Flavivirga aquatica]|uniref:Uncharacterized protein n=1 Tax=Flavivirga aquatica TaxID=1849968 RepID=A0A1E5SJ31_9FLAO|nr:AHH domain-containing protein [Flavivirga aquatica]OEJ99128.1 hypothetical protein A8C32_08105 [Flavivirga aquatica]
MNQKSNTEITCLWSCGTVHTPPRNCTAGGNHSPEEINECEGSPGQLPSAGEIQAYCFEYGCTTEGGGSNENTNTSSPQGSTTGSSPFTPVPTPKGWTPEYVCVKTDPINGSCVETVPYTPIISSPVIPNDLGIKLYEALNIEVSSNEYDWLEAHHFERRRVSEFLIDNGFSSEAVTEVSMRIKTEMVNDADPTTPQWNFSKKGTYLNREALKYKATSDVLGTFGTEKMYLLENGLVLYVANGKKRINKASVSLPSSEVSNEGYHYIYSFDTKKYYEYRLPPTSYQNADINFLLDAFWAGTKTVAKYATPLEDAIILLDGKDFDGVAQSKVQTAGFMLVGFIPGGKILKPVSKIVKNSNAALAGWKIITKIGDDTVSLSFKVINGVVEFGNRSKLTKIIKTTSLEEAHHIIPWNKLDNEVIQEAAYAGFHMNAKINGRALQKFSSLTGDGLHGNHPAYDKYVQKRLNDFIWKTSKEARNFLEEILIPELNEHIDDAVDSTMNLNAYFRDVINPANGID